MKKSTPKIYALLSLGKNTAKLAESKEQPDSPIERFIFIFDVELCPGRSFSWPGLGIAGSLICIGSLYLTIYCLSIPLLFGLGHFILPVPHGHLVWPQRLLANQ